jgi:hypothetical protein
LKRREYEGWNVNIFGWQYKISFISSFITSMMIVAILKFFKPLKAKISWAISYVLGTTNLSILYHITTQRDGTLVACGVGVYESHINECGINFIYKWNWFQIPWYAMLPSPESTYTTLVTSISVAHSNFFVSAIILVNVSFSWAKPRFSTSVSKNVFRHYRSKY